MSLLSILSPNSTKSLPAPHLSTPKFSAQAATKLHTFRSPPSTKIPSGPSLDDYTPMLHPAESYMHDRAKYSEMKQYFTLDDIEVVSGELTKSYRKDTIKAIAFEAWKRVRNLRYLKVAVRRAILRSAFRAVRAAVYEDVYYTWYQQRRALQFFTRLRQRVKSRARDKKARSLWLAKNCETVLSRIKSQTKYRDANGVYLTKLSAKVLTSLRQNRRENMFGRKFLRAWFLQAKAKIGERLTVSKLQEESMIKSLEFYEEKLLRNVVFYWRAGVVGQQAQRVMVAKFRRKCARRSVTSSFCRLRQWAHYDPRQIVLRRVSFRALKKNACHGAAGRWVRAKGEKRLRETLFRAWLRQLRTRAFMIYRDLDSFREVTLCRKALRSFQAFRWQSRVWLVKAQRHLWRPRLRQSLHAWLRYRRYSTAKRYVAMQNSTTNRSILAQCVSHWKTKLQTLKLWRGSVLTECAQLHTRHILYNWRMQCLLREIQDDKIVTAFQIYYKLRTGFLGFKLVASRRRLIRHRRRWFSRLLYAWLTVVRDLKRYRSKVFSMSADVIHFAHPNETAAKYVRMQLYESRALASSGQVTGLNEARIRRQYFGLWLARFWGRKKRYCAEHWHVKKLLAKTVFGLKSNRRVQALFLSFVDLAVDFLTDRSFPIRLVSALKQCRPAAAVLTSAKTMLQKRVLTAFKLYKLKVQRFRHHQRQRVWRIGFDQLRLVYLRGRQIAAMRKLRASKSKKLMLSHWVYFVLHNSLESGLVKKRQQKLVLKAWVGLRVLTSTSVFLHAKDFRAALTAARTFGPHATPTLHKVARHWHNHHTTRSVFEALVTRYHRKSVKKVADASFVSETHLKSAEKVLTLVTSYGRATSTPELTEHWTKQARTSSHYFAFQVRRQQKLLRDVLVDWRNLVRVTTDRGRESGQLSPRLLEWHRAMQTKRLRRAILIGLRFQRKQAGFRRWTEFKPDLTKATKPKRRKLPPKPSQPTRRQTKQASDPHPHEPTHAEVAKATKFHTTRLKTVVFKAWVKAMYRAQLPVSPALSQDTSPTKLQRPSPTVAQLRRDVKALDEQIAAETGAQPRSPRSRNLSEEKRTAPSSIKQTNRRSTSLKTLRSNSNKENLTDILLEASKNARKQKRDKAQLIYQQALDSYNNYKSLVKVGNHPQPALQMNQAIREERHKKVVDIIKNSNSKGKLLEQPGNPLSQSVREMSQSVSNLGHFLAQVKNDMMASK